MSKIVFLLKEHIYLIHEQTIKDFGGFEGVYDFTDGRIESILSQQFLYFGHEKYPSVLHKAAMLMYLFTKGHCFRDGNKRVGINSAIVFLKLNGFIDCLEDDEGYQKTLEIATLNLSGAEVDNYIKSLEEWLSKRFINTPRTKRILKYRRKLD